MSSRVIRGERAGRLPAARFAPARREAGVAPAPDDSTGPRARLARAEWDQQQAVREAREEGRRDGQAQAREAAEAELRAGLDRVAQAAAELAALRPRLIREAETGIIRLAVEIARRVLRRELTLDARVLEGLVHAAAERLREEPGYRVRVHPEHEAAVRGALERGGAAGRAEVAPDPALPAGTLLFETPNGKLDASIHSQLAEIERGLADAL